MTCNHEATVPVTLLNGEEVADMCRDCYSQLPVGYNCDDCEHEDLLNMTRTVVSRIFTARCERHRPRPSSP